MNTDEYGGRICEVELHIPTAGSYDVAVDRKISMQSAACVTCTITAANDAGDVLGADLTGSQQVLDIDVVTSLVLVITAMKRGQDGPLDRLESLRLRHLGLPT